MSKFNLLEEPWIPVMKDRQVREVGVGQALLEAHAIERIEAPSPLEEAALHRLLLAVLYRAIPPVKDEYDALDLLERGQLHRPSIEGYLDRHYVRFHLFDETAPFLQIPDLPQRDPLYWSKLLPELASGNNPTLFDHTTVENVPLASYAQAARALLVHQTFALGGLVRRLGVSSGKDAPMARPAAFLAVGNNLFQTLLLNLAPQDPKGDLPIWEERPLRAADVRKDEEGPPISWSLHGAARVYTWPSRGVLLLDEGNGVRRIAYGPGVEPLQVAWTDPMAAYGLARTGKILPLRLSMDKSFWRDFQAMLPEAGGSWPATLKHASAVAREAKIPVQIRVLGQVSDQAKVLDIRREVYPLPPGLITERGEALLKSALEDAEAMGNALSEVGRAVARAVLRDKDPQELGRFQKSLPLLRVYWAALDLAFLEFLEFLDEKGALDRWKERVRGAARRAWEETRRFVGTAGRHLKALAEGERVLFTAMRR